jgi:membrane protein required for colicin V production
MVWVDIALLVLLAVYVIGGIAKGYRREIYSLVVLIIGFFVAWFFSPDFAVLLLKVFHTTSTRYAVSFLVLVAVTTLIGNIINWLANSFKKNRLTLFDRLGGLVAGFIHGLLVVFILVTVAGLTPLPKDRWWQQSKYLSPFQSLAILVKGTISTNIASSINYR